MPPIPSVSNITSLSNYGQPPCGLSGLLMAQDLLHASAAETAAGNSTDRDYSAFRSGHLWLNLSAFTGTNITFTFEVKDDGAAGAATTGRSGTPAR